MIYNNVAWLQTMIIAPEDLQGEDIYLAAGDQYGSGWWGDRWKNVKTGVTTRHLRASRRVFGYVTILALHPLLRTTRGTMQWGLVARAAPQPTAPAMAKTTSPPVTSARTTFCQTRWPPPAATPAQVGRHLAPCSRRARPSRGRRRGTPATPTIHTTHGSPSNRASAHGGWELCFAGASGCSSIHSIWLGG